MSVMDDKEHDDLVETIARGIEEGSLLDIMGIGARRKRAREDAALRMKARQEQRAELAGFVRAFKRGEGRDPMVELARISEAGGELSYSRFCDISSEEAAGHVSVEAVVALSDFSFSDAIRFVARLTEKGKAALNNPSPPAQQADRG